MRIVNVCVGRGKTGLYFARSDDLPGLLTVGLSPKAAFEAVPGNALAIFAETQQPIPPLDFRWMGASLI